VQATSGENDAALAAKNIHVMNTLAAEAAALGPDDLDKVTMFARRDQLLARRSELEKEA
jgi:hypothetical protein